MDKRDKIILKFLGDRIPPSSKRVNKNRKHCYMPNGINTADIS